MSRKFVANPRLRHTGTVADELLTDAGDVPEAPSSYDTTVAHPARVYNYWLGGKDNFEADRVVGEQTRAAYPDIVTGVRAQRAFLASAVRYLVWTTILWSSRMPGRCSTVGQKARAPTSTPTSAIRGRYCAPLRDCSTLTSQSPSC